MGRRNIYIDISVKKSLTSLKAHKYSFHLFFCRAWAFSKAVLMCCRELVKVFVIAEGESSTCGFVNHRATENQFLLYSLKVQVETTRNRPVVPAA